MYLKKLLCGTAAFLACFGLPVDLSFGDTDGTGSTMANRSARSVESLMTVCNTNDAGEHPTDRSPSNVSGAVSRTRIVVVTNTHIGVYRKGNCARIGNLIALQSLFGELAAEEEAVNRSQVIYDEISRRFFVVGLGANNSNEAQRLLFAVSHDESAKEWYVYRRVLDQICGLRTEPDAGVQAIVAGQNAARWLLTLRHTDPDNAITGGIISIDKGPTLHGGEPAVKCFYPLQANVVPPQVQDSSTTGYFLSSGAHGASNIERYALSTAGGSARTDTLEVMAPIQIPFWSAPPDAPQPGDPDRPGEPPSKGQLLDSGDGGFETPSVQIGDSLWVVHTVASGGFSRWRLYKLPTEGAAPDFVLTPSSVSEADDYLFNASVAVEPDPGAGRAFVTFSRTRIAADGNAAMLIAEGPRDVPSGWTSRLAATSEARFERFGGFTCNSTHFHCRFRGSATQIDPVSGGAWAFNQLAVGDGDWEWTTRAAKVD